MAKAKQAWKNYLGFWDRLTRKKRVLFCLVYYTVLFLITFLLAYSPFLLAGKSFILAAGDGRTQHYPTLVYIGRYLRQIVLELFQGKLSIPLFDLNLAMGGDVIATLNYYGFGNPLYLLSALVPSHYTEYLYNILVVVRLYLAGLSFLALCRHHQKETSYALIGALVYVFSGYAIFAAVRHPYFVEPMIQLPLLLIGIDLVIKKRKPFIFIFSVFYSALCGFYFLYMMTIMLGVYTLVHFFDCYYKNRAREFISMAGRIITAYLIGLGMAAVIFVPSVVSFLTSGRSEGATEQNYFFYGWSFYGNGLAKLIAPPGTWDVLSLGAITLLALVVLFTQKRRYRGLKLLVLVAVTAYVLPLGGHIMNGFSYPSQRWTFGFALLLSYILVEMLPTLLNLDKKQQLLCFGTLLFYGIMIFFETKSRNVYNVVGVAMLAITLLTLCLFGEKGGKESGRRIGLLACAMLVIGNVGINAIYCFAEDQNNYVEVFTIKGTETKVLETAIEREAESYLAEKVGRVDSSSFSRNAGAVWRIPTMYTYWSMINKNVSEFYIKTENTAQRDKSFGIWGTNERTNVEELLSTRYFVEKTGKEQNVPYGYRLLKRTDSGNLIYENQYALPWGYTYDSYISADSASKMNGLEIAEAMLQHIVLEENVPMESGRVESDIQTLPYTIKEQKDIEWKDGVLTVGKNNAIMTLEFQMPQKVEGYLRLQGLNISNSGQSNLMVTMKCADVQKNIGVASSSTNWYYGRENYLVNLGYSEEERTICTITFPKKGTYKLDDIQLFALPMDKYPEQVEALRAEPLENIVWETNKISGTVDLSKNKILCMSIPYSMGWTARVDGKKVEILKGNYMFMALPLEAGHHDIEFTYCTPGLKAGIGCSVLSLGMVILLGRKYKRRTDEDEARK